ncbi:MAG: Gfo/Idh/MocA family oxidoreductase [Planctomycetes bacterium]|nr:Gfo/Idh/MocA family oxidoreductase [Planctomycetota bacterium]MCB9917988.1 Gfo/Idh/MocA family oxidoreductase [Planctomycetota bacterium]
MNARELPRIAIVGTGFLAVTRMRCYHDLRAPGAVVVTVCSRDPERARVFAREHAIGSFDADFEAVLAREDVDAVDLCVPNRLHRDYCERAAAHGKHVVCTKPLTAYVGQDLGDDVDPATIGQQERRAMAHVAIRDARAMETACREAGVRLYYGENWVHAPAIQRMSGFLPGAGRILEMRGYEAHKGSHSRFSMRWADAGGGALLRLGAHPIGAMLWLKREEGTRTRGRAIECVSVIADVAVLTRDLDERETPLATGWVDVENWGTCILEFDDGARGIAWASDNQLGGMQSKLEVNTSAARFECTLSPSDALRAYAPSRATFGDRYVQEKLDDPVGWMTPIPSEDVSSGQQGMIDEFATALREGRDSATDGALGVDVTRVVYAAYVAASEGRRVLLSEFDS